MIPEFSAFRFNLCPLGFQFAQPGPDIQKSDISLVFFAHHQPTSSSGRFVIHLWSSGIVSSTIYRYQYLTLNILRIRKNPPYNYSPYLWLQAYSHTVLFPCLLTIRRPFPIWTSEWHWHSDWLKWKRNTHSVDPLVGGGRDGEGSNTDARFNSQVHCMKD